MRASLRTVLILAALAKSTPGFGTAPPDEGPSAPPVQIVLYPAAPQPALKYQLLPPIYERRPGNAAVWWNRLPAERTVFLIAFTRKAVSGTRLKSGWTSRWPIRTKKRIAPRQWPTALASSRPILFVDMDRGAIRIV